MHRKRFTRLGVITVVGAATMGFAGLGMTAGPNPARLLPPRVAAAETLPECPRDWEDKLPKRLGGRRSESDGFFVPGPITDVPEYHDCQRLIRGDSYGPLVAVFAAYDLRSLSDRLDSIHARYGHSDAKPREGTQGKPPSGSYVKRPNDQASRIEGDSEPILATDLEQPAGEQPVVDSALVGALILNLSLTASYDPLHIKPKFNCLYMWKTGTSDTKLQWHARIVAVDTADSLCLRPIDPNRGAGTELPVSAHAFTGFEANDYPPVARWDWDSKTRQQYIGIRCGAAWCDVGRDQAPLTISKPISGAGMSLAEQRVRTIKGWYDQQRLAIVKTPSGSPGGVGATMETIPSNLIGTLFPAPNRVTPQRDNYYGNWPIVAYAALSDASPYYEKMLNFRKVGLDAPLDSMNVFSMCYGSRTTCHVPNIGDPSAWVSKCGTTGSPDVERWWVRIDAAGAKKTVDATHPWKQIVPDIGRGGAGSRGGGRGAVNTIKPMFRCVTQRGHEHLNPIPHTARWRWLLDDETTWFECIQGCCETEAHTLAM